MSEFTEVPWIAVKRSDDPEDKVWQVRCERFELGQGEPHMVHNHCSESRARLIAAAPELLEALQTLRSFMWSEGYADQTLAIAQADAAIAKAEGK